MLWNLRIAILRKFNITWSTDVSIQKTHPIQVNDFQGKKKNSLSFFLATVPSIMLQQASARCIPDPLCCFLPLKMQPHAPFLCPCPPVQHHHAIRKRAQRSPTTSTSQPTTAFHFTEMKTLKQWMDLAFVKGVREGGYKTPFHPVIFCTDKT